MLRLNRGGLSFLPSSAVLHNLYETFGEKNCWVHRFSFSSTAGESCTLTALWSQAIPLCCTTEMSLEPQGQRSSLAAPASAVKILYFVYQVLSMCDQYKVVLKKYVTFLYSLVCLLYTPHISNRASHISSAYYPHVARGHHVTWSSSDFGACVKDGCLQ